MICPYCNSQDSKVIDKRETPDSKLTRRRRECLKCKKRFTTYERIEQKDLFVVKKDKRREPFDREKLESGLIKACQKRPISHESIEKVLNEIELMIRKKKKTEITSKEIGEIVMKKLKKLDKIAYIRFASVYREFQDIRSFEKELKSLK
ncbi:MAG: transcriptional repressor NrdR [Candidatus Aenigmarchaeota archaeon]|nr:transcriptional repressor NrdR [Candidatus Aenigmarchaeota archaeon]